MRKFKASAVAALALVTVVGVGTAGVAAAGGIPTDSRSSSGQQVRGEASVSDRPTAVELQQGLVLEGAGTTNGLAASVTVYENSLHGNSVQVVLGDPEDDKIGAADQAEPFVVDGVLNATVSVDGKSAVLSGTVQRIGNAEKVVEPQQDAGEQIVTKGTQTRLSVDATLTYDGVSVPLEFAPAFGYELEVRKVSLYGN